MTAWLRRHTLGLLIVLAWLGVLGWQYHRQYYKPETLVLKEGARLLAPGSYFFVVRMRGTAIGMATSRLDTLADGFRFHDLLQLDIPAMDSLHQAVAETQVSLSKSLALDSFNFHLDSEVGRFEVRGRAMPDSVLALSINAGDKVQHATMRLDPSMVMAAALPLRLAASGQLRTGAQFTLDLFDPSVMSSRPVKMTVVRQDTLIVPDSAALDSTTHAWYAAAYDTVPVWQVRQAYGGVTTDSWVDANGRSVKETSPMGFTLERTVYELARQEWQRARSNGALAAGYGTIIESTAIASNVDLDRVGGRDSLDVVLGGVDLAGFDLAGGRQTLRGDTLRVRRESGADLSAGYALPYTGGGAPAAKLGSTPLIQSHDPEIVRAARRIVRGMKDPKDPVQVARRLNAWVYSRLRKEITLSVPSAVQVLEERRGDCNEHTVLYVALARALGLPARTAVGLVYVRGRFYYHAWPEVWLGRQWVAVDPTLGEFPADASHLRFVIGGLAQQVNLIQLIGRLRLKVL